ncbi:MAG: ACP S-malonyltransferase [Spirochaetales bacterium]
MKTCFLFPGQGAQYPGMAKDFFETSKAVRQLFELASEASTIDMKKLLFDSDEETLKQTQNTQIALALAESAAALSAREHGIVPSGFAGFSVGEWPALAEAGILSSFDMFRLVSERGRLMDEAGRNSGGSTMSAVLFLSSDKVEQAIAEAGLKNVWVANYNSPVQCVISGTEIDVAAAEEKLKAAGAKRVVRLKVSGAFHSPIMNSAKEAFAALLGDIAFNDPKTAVYSNVTGARILSGRQARELASAQIISPVKWVAEEGAISADGFDRCVETGPGSVLSGLWKASGSTIPCFAGGTLDSIASISL